ncbi:MAG: hypothetical protein FJY42_11230 [Betaproteobacteria bacterium]|nr:hypothetical protein [Betaproteobacteria bacterium]
MHPIYAAFLNRPDLLAQHLQAYGDLVQIQTRVFGRALRLRLWAALLAWVSALLALIWGGMAGMLVLLLERQHAALWYPPATALLLGLVCAVLATRPLPMQVLRELKPQITDDVQALRAVNRQP